VDPIDSLVNDGYAYDVFISKLEPGDFYICGDADSDCSWLVNVSDAVYVIAYIFAGGPPPNPFLAGDVNCDEVVNISDVVYLIAFIFDGGPEPCADCT
jgi:hypothetical protein